MFVVVDQDFTQVIFETLDLRPGSGWRLHHEVVEDGKTPLIILDPYQVLAQLCIVLLVGDGLGLPPNVPHQDTEFTAHPFHGIIGHVVDPMVESGLVVGRFLMVKIMGVMEGCLFKEPSILPVKGSIAVGAKHLETPRFLFDRGMAPRAWPGGLCDGLQGTDLVFRTGVRIPIFLVAPGADPGTTGQTGMCILRDLATGTQRTRTQDILVLAPVRPFLQDTSAVFLVGTLPKRFIQVLPKTQNIPGMAAIHTMGVPCDANQIGLDTGTAGLVLTLHTLDHLVGATTTHTTLHLFTIYLYRTTLFKWIGLCA